jgi:hypothetical protein
MVTGNYQPHLTTLPFLPDPALLLPIRAWFPLSRTCFWKRADPVALDPGIGLSKTFVCVLSSPTYDSEYTPQDAATDIHHRAHLQIFRPRFQRERIHSIQRFLWVYVYKWICPTLITARVFPYEFEHQNTGISWV